MITINTKVKIRSCGRTGIVVRDDGKQYMVRVSSTGLVEYLWRLPEELEAVK